MRIASQVKMPSLLAAYAAHGIRSQGLPAKTLRRIYAVRAAEPVPIVGESRPQPEDERVLDSWDECPREVEPGLEKALRRFLPKRNAPDALKTLRKIIADESQTRSVTTNLILEFAEDLLSPERGEKRMQMGTLRACVPTTRFQYPVQPENN